MKLVKRLDKLDCEPITILDTQGTQRNFNVYSPVIEVENQLKLF